MNQIDQPYYYDHEQLFPMISILYEEVLLGTYHLLKKRHTSSSCQVMKLSVERKRVSMILFEINGCGRINCRSLIGCFLKLAWMRKFRSDVKR